MTPDILCIGSVLWDIIGRASVPLAAGGDVPGRITRLPGGVALNIALTLARLGLRPGLLTAIGRDIEGEDLIRACAARGLICDQIHRTDRPTDVYMAIEAEDRLVAAIADAHTLEAEGAAILAPLADGRLGRAEAPWAGPIALDGNLTEALLTEIAGSALFARADLRVAPASPGKAMRLVPLLSHPGATLYVNLEEARQIGHCPGADAPQAASALVARGATRVLVTDGARPCAMGHAGGVLVGQPPKVQVRRITGAGDTFMAAHIVAEGQGQGPEAALQSALRAAADYISQEVGA
jgi:sugar/nucleoside kinase (ribokinase family)